MSNEIKTTISVNGGPEADFDKVMAILEGPAKQPVRVRGKLLKTIIKACCDKPKKEDPEKPLDSIAVGNNSIAATDRFMAVRLGEQEDVYRPTSRRSALLESERENLYGDIVHFENIEPLLKPDGTGEVENFPGVDKILGQIADMKYVGSLNPALLLRACQIAVAGNASSIELYAQGDSLIGFEFEVVPDEDQFDLFEGATEPIPSCGVIATKKGRGRKDDDEDDVEGDE